MLISLSYFMFLSKTDLFSKSFERYKYQGYSFSFDEVATNKNPLYPEFIFKDISLHNENEEIKIFKLSLTELKKINESKSIQNVLTKISIYEYFKKFKKS